ncbi:MAG: hypothetical protein QG608_3111 [Actinomycetota bacterium]|nr:hypothetical protein [Actinomycetota bacterium]
MSIREVKETIANNHELVDEVVTALETTKEKLTEMLETVTTVTEQSESPKLEEAIGGMTRSVELLDEIITTMKTAQENSEEYSTML